MHGLKTAALGALAAAALATAGGASATTYLFSYTFSSTDTITGSFQGTGSTVLGVTTVTNLSHIYAKYDGVPLASVGPGGLNPYVYTDPGGSCGTCYAAGGAVASTNPLDNNFLFINSNNNLATYTNYFYIIPWPNGGGNPEAVQYYNNGYYNTLYNGNFIPGNWSLIVAPEPATWTMMLAGFLGLGAVLRRARRQQLATA